MHILFHQITCKSFEYVAHLLLYNTILQFTLDTIAENKDRVEMRERERMRGKNRNVEWGVK